MWLVYGQPIEQEELAMPLLSFSSISKRDSKGEMKLELATSFDAVTHVQQLEHIFHYYNVNVH